MFRHKIKIILLDAVSIFLKAHEYSPDAERLSFEIGPSAESWWGDYFTNLAFPLGKATRENPMKVAEELKEIIWEQDQKGEHLFSKIDAIEPGYLNFWIEPHHFERLIKTILQKKSPFLKMKETIIIDFSGPNIAKPMGVGHLRSTILGQALVNLYKFLGYRVIGDNHLGDWGTQFGALLYQYKKKTPRFTFQPPISKNIVESLFDLYTEFFKNAEKNPELWEMAKEETKKLQKGDRENRRLWKWFVRESIKEFNKIYKILGVKFDVQLGESFYNTMLKDLVKGAIKSGVAKEEGAVTIFFDGLQPCIIQKADGAYLYSTTDLATIVYRAKRWKPIKILYVVSNEQTLHFEQVFEAAARLGYVEKEKLVHAKFGLVLGEKGTKMSTRKGEIIRLEELIQKAISLARKVIDKTNPKLPAHEKDKIARIVGIGAIKWNDFSQHRLKDIVFDWSKMLNIKGESAPYVQYTYARLRSIIRKSNIKYQKSTLRLRSGQEIKNQKLIHLLRENEEQLILRHLLHYFEVIEDVANLYEPHRFAEHLYKLAVLTNNFYEKLPVLQAETKIRKARLVLTNVVIHILQQGLGLLGIDVPERM